MRSQFPFFSQNSSVCYLDNAATTQKLASVIEFQTQFQSNEYATVGRADYALANKATAQLEDTRRTLATFINANENEIVFTSGATESINLVARGINRQMLNGDTILICASEHHANLLPWQQLANELELTIKILPLTANGEFTASTFDQWQSYFTPDVCLVACAHVSNVLGNIFPVKDICALAHSINAISVIDGTQAVAHMSVDVSDLNCDFYVFSAHKMYGPTGVGVLFGKFAMLEQLKPSKLGGEMVSQVSYQHYVPMPPPTKFEAGTANITGILAFKSAVEFLQANMQSIASHEHQLNIELVTMLSQFPNIRLLGNIEQQTVGVLSFYFEDADNYQIAISLWQQNVAIRYGQHCAMPLIASLGISGCLRVSLACYSNKDDLQKLQIALQTIFTNNQDKELEQHREQVAIDSQGVSEHIQAINKANDWSAKHRSLLLMSKLLPILEENDRQDTYYISGCEAKVWLKQDIIQGWQAYSDSKVIRGILTLLISKSGEFSTPSDYVQFLQEIGLAHYFSESRRNGVNQIIQRLTSNL
ncbi:aminotransferase class V-fold PLP-dependent enzyme [Glaciecola sp. 1036]|uniref:aminotransferase class V-fold PLP-dependent enzyme n=1 Tax=Alteromonadaceae TaxID=72275 RepID=UPI003CFFE64F